MQPTIRNCIILDKNKPTQIVFSWVLAQKRPVFSADKPSDGKSLLEPRLFVRLHGQLNKFSVKNTAF